MAENPAILPKQNAGISVLHIVNGNTLKTSLIMQALKKKKLNTATALHNNINWQHVITSFLR